MDAALRLQLSRRILAAAPRHQTCQIKRHLPSRLALSQLQTRHASSSSNPSSSKPIILEQPDKFRPPSHPARLNTRKTTANYGAYQGGYNQGATDREREAQKKKSYPHMFPDHGTFMHWFLTNRILHLWITLGILTSLAIVTMTQNFLQTSPFAHLVPPLSSLPYHPINYLSDWYSVFRLSIDYETEKTYQKRMTNIADTQKRRLYRRSHGMEDLDRQEDQGVDVRGLVPWDDGLTNKERARGGRIPFEMDMRARQVRTGLPRGEDEVEIGGRVYRVDTIKEVIDGVEVERPAVPGPVMPPPERKKVKRWLGIWE